MNTSPWNKGRIVGQKRPLQISHIWGIRIRLELEGKTRDLALFNMALDSKLRGCDLVDSKTSSEHHRAGIRGDSATACHISAHEPQMRPARPQGHHILLFAYCLHPHGHHILGLRNDS